MKNLFALVGFVVVVFLGAGNYYGWYTFRSQTTLDGRTQYQFDVDTRKLAQDARAVGERVSTVAAPAEKPAPALQPLPPGLMGPPSPMTATSASEPQKRVEAGFTPAGGFEIRVPPRR